MSKPEDFIEIEQLLVDLPVREPSQMLDERIVTTLRQEQSAASTPRWNRSVIWRFAGIAAVVVIIGYAGSLFLLRDFPPAPDANPELVQPPTQPDGAPPHPTAVANTSHDKPVHLVWTRDVGEQTRYTPAGRPYRAVVRQTIDQRVWVDPETGESVQITTPREELYIAEQPVF